jgi:hypothetical protein
MVQWFLVTQFKEDSLKKANALCQNELINQKNAAAHAFTVFLNECRPVTAVMSYITAGLKIAKSLVPEK